jgi:hypothetical protein
MEHAVSAFGVQKPHVKCGINYVNKNKRVWHFKVEYLSLCLLLLWFISEICVFEYQLWLISVMIGTWCLCDRASLEQRSVTRLTVSPVGSSVGALYQKLYIRVESKVLLRMGEFVARNMWGWFKRMKKMNLFQPVGCLHPYSFIYSFIRSFSSSSSSSSSLIFKCALHYDRSKIYVTYWIASY